MKITGIKSMCCNDGVKTRNLEKATKEELDNDKIWLCLKCRQPCEAFYICKVYGN